MLWTDSTALIRSILGPIRADIRPLAYAVDITADILFRRKVPMDDVLITKDVYPDVAKQANRSVGAVSRQIERLSNLCWETIVNRELVMEYIGASISDIRAPRDMIFYLAYLLHFGKPFYAVIDQSPALLF